MSENEAGEQQYGAPQGQPERSGQPEQGPPSPWSAAGQAQAYPGQQAQGHQAQPGFSGAEDQIVYGSAAHASYGAPYGQPGQQHGQPGQPGHTHTMPGGVPPAPPAQTGGAQSQEPAPEGRRRGSAGLIAGVAVLSLVVGGAAGVIGGQLGSDDSGGTSVSALEAPPPAKQASTAPPGSVESVAQKVTPSVAQLQVQGAQGEGEGSAFVLTSDGYLLTNNHVVAGAGQGGEIRAVFQDGRSVPVEVVGTDPTADLAVVKADGVNNLRPAELGRSDDLNVGQQVVAIGSPYELTGTVTSGIVSALNRPVRAGGDTGDQTTVMDAVQTDAAINPGNSGGPLVDMKGRVIGINSAIYSPSGATQSSGGSVGIGFAIPIDQARRTADEIIKTGKATQTVLGVTVQDAPQGGALIADVTSKPATGTDLRAGDVVTKLDNRTIDSSDALVAAVRSHKPGDTVTLTVGESKTITVKLGGKPAGTR